MDTICVYNNKGGVGKTTSVINIASSLSIKGKKVLIVDLDPQCCLSDFVLAGIEYEKDTLMELITGEKNLGNVIKTKCYTHFDKNKKKRVDFSFDIIPLNEDLTGIDFEDLTILKSILSEVESKYDYCIIDMQPTESSITYLGLCASDYLISPCLPDTFSARAISNVQKVFENCKSINPNLKFIGAFLNMCNFQRAVHKQVIKEYESATNIFLNTKIKNSACFDEANILLIPVCSITSSTGSENYAELTDEIINKIKTL